ncbi:hypothetical protein BDF20DRAFT_478713 [Mycotypha africana]|uniref:uncharacterized protein n=1 Tax=Mycotypha africana TaxID=64632 RepID=UPI002301E00A|nr:uncharacterized protein BDF20DRAFT_478713 [Mycotypha africana]KAI8979079.1 hypothetical protein BDF20DRAFT_478713 [Mycotypha africana]
MPVPTSSVTMDTKHCIDVAIEKANMAVQYDAANDIPSAIAAYTEAVQYLFNALQQQQQQKEASRHDGGGATDPHDIDGLMSICHIYMERIDCLSHLKAVLPQKQQATVIASGNDCTNHHHKSKFNSVFMNIFHKKTIKKKKSLHVHPPQHPSHSPTTTSLPHLKTSTSTPLPTTTTTTTTAAVSMTATHPPYDTPSESRKQTRSFSENLHQYLGKALSFPGHSSFSPSCPVSTTATTTTTNASASTIYYCQQQQQKQFDHYKRNSYPESLSSTLSTSSSSLKSSRSSRSSSSSRRSISSSHTNTNTTTLATQPPCQKQYNMNRDSYVDHDPLSPSSSFFYLDNTSSHDHPTHIPYQHLLKSGGGGASVIPHCHYPASTGSMTMIDPNIILNYPEAKVL